MATTTVQKVFPYKVTIQFSATEGKYVARVPALNISAVAATMPEAAAQVQQMGEVLILAHHRRNRRLPVEAP